MARVNLIRVVTVGINARAFGGKGALDQPTDFADSESATGATTIAIVTATGSPKIVFHLTSNKTSPRTHGYNVLVLLQVPGPT